MSSASEALLHLLNCPPGHGAVDRCLSLAGSGDAILLMGDGVYCALPGSEVAGRLEAAGIAVHVLDEDAAARGVLPLLRGPFTAVDMAGFVELTERFTRSQSWY